MGNNRPSVDSNETTEETMVEKEMEGEMGAGWISSEAGKIRIGTKPSEEFLHSRTVRSVLYLTQNVVWTLLVT